VKCVYQPPNAPECVWQHSSARINWDSLLWDSPDPLTGMRQEQIKIRERHAAEKGWKMEVKFENPRAKSSRCKTGCY